MADFIANTTERIRARNLRAEPVLAELGGLRRFMAKSSLFMGNVVDRIGGWMSDGTAAFTEGAAFGAVRGGLAGGAAYMGISVLLPFIAAAALPIAGVIFAGYLLHDSARSYNHVKAHDPRYKSAKRADWLASAGGALGPAHTPNPNERHNARSAVRSANAEAYTAKHIARTTDLEPQMESHYPDGIVPGGFAEAELKRREGQAQNPQLSGQRSF